MKKILVPIDFSNESEIAIDFAKQVAKKHNYSIKLVHVFEYPMSTAYTTMDVGGPDPLESSFVSEMMKRNKDLLEDTAKKLIEIGIKVEQDIKIGNPFINISSELEDEGLDFVIMGSKGVSGIEEILIGSNTEKVVRHAKCPVIVVKRPIKIETIKNIVFASNFKEEDDNLINHLKQLQEMFDAKINFVRINTLNNFEPDVFSKKRINNWLSNQKFQNYSIRIYNDIEEEEGIIHYAEEIGADMLALGTHGRTGLGRLFSGSLAEDVVNHAKRPIWTYHISKSG